MTAGKIVSAGRFHGYLDGERPFGPGSGWPQQFSSHLVVQERDVAYRFQLHQHPYAQELMQRLLRTGTAGLQAADTDHDPERISLPGSLTIRLGDEVALTVPAGARLFLAGPVQAVSAGGGTVALAAHAAVVSTGEAGAALPGGLLATLVDGMTPTPALDAQFEPAPGSPAIVSADTPIKLAAAVPVSLADGSAAILPADTEVLLARGTTIAIPPGAKAILLGSRLRARLFADFFDAAYMPAPALVQQPYPVKDLDFSSSGAYAAYNWELFFHVPLTIAIHLSKNQRFAEAQQWFHYLFDPTDDSDGPTPERYWKVQPFRTTDLRKIEELLINLATGADEALRTETILSMEAWKDAPFRPHVIARYRQQAYMYKTVMAYLDNLIAWGDSLFRQDTGEAIDEALMLYVLAANILGPRPQPVPRKGRLRTRTYASLRDDLNQFGTVLRDVEADLPFDLMPLPADDGGDDAPLVTLRSMGKALYFCVPRNDKMLGYWDTVADRLFKIRNSLNLQGVFRQLALFEPPIDPAMLVRATAAGLDVSSIVNGLNQPLPLVRFQLLAQRASELCQEVKSLAAGLLAAMEKEDGEAMALLRAKHERVVMEMVEQLRYGQLQEAIKAKEGLLQSLTAAVHRYAHYERQLGKTEEEIADAIPDLDELDRDSLERMRFTMDEPEVALRDIEIDIAPNLNPSGGRIVSSHEMEELRKSGAAKDIKSKITALQLLAQGLTLLPTPTIEAAFWGVGASAETVGGRQLATVAGIAADIFLMRADNLNFQAGQAAKIGGYVRREQDWAFQSNVAAGEISQIFKQIRAAEIRQAMAELELKNHRLQMRQAEEIERFLNAEGADPGGKTTNKALYAWMKREVKGLYGQCFQLAFDVAKKAERALQHELGDPSLSYLQYRLSRRQGRFAGG